MSGNEKHLVQVCEMIREKHNLTPMEVYILLCFWQTWMAFGEKEVKTGLGFVKEDSEYFVKSPLSVFHNYTDTWELTNKGKVIFYDFLVNLEWNEVFLTMITRQEIITGNGIKNKKED